MNIRQNLVFSALISILVTLAVGGIGLTGMNIAASGVDRVSVIADAIRHHMQADMMHDALRGDVLLGLKASAEGNIVAVTEAADLVQGHSAEFKASIDENTDLMLSEEIQQTLLALRPSLDAYIASANDIVELARG